MMDFRAQFDHRPLIIDRFAGGGGAGRRELRPPGRVPGGGGMKHVVMFSAGGGSWAAARRVVERHGVGDVTLLFTDTLMEDQDAYRFLIEGAADVMGVAIPTQMVPSAHQFPDWEDRAAYKLFVQGLRLEFEGMLPGLVWLARGGDIWDVFREERFLGNSSVDPCSKRLKRQMAAAWLKAHCVPDQTIVYVGIDKFEEHRFDDGEGGGVRPRRAAQGWTYQAPLTEAPFVSPWDVRGLMRARGLQPPRLYGLGYPHNNCGGVCVKAGHAQWALLLRTQPERFAFAEGQENAFRDILGNVSILTDRSGDAVKKPLTLGEFRARIEATPQLAMAFDDWNAGCECFLEAA
jgi:hypothetical protein